MKKQGGGTLKGAVRRRPHHDGPSAAQEIIEGNAWRTADPSAPPARDPDGKYVQTFLLRLNEWEIGALAAAAKSGDRSAQQTARRLLRHGLMRELGIPGPEDS